MGGMMSNGMMGAGSFGGWGGMGFGLPGLGMLIFWGLLIAGGVLLVRLLSGRGQGTPEGGGAGEALAVLAVRFAKGELSEGEYESMRKTISGR